MTSDKTVVEEMLAEIFRQAPHMPAGHADAAAQACAAVAAKRIEELEAANSNLRGGLETAAKTFRRYGELHRAKGTTEGNLKASNNDDLAEFCESVIADSAALSHPAGAAP
jgi:hypothetical protein